MVGSMTQNLGQIIQASGGIFSRSQALDCGEADRSLAAAVREGTLVRLRRGFYTPADIYAAADPRRSTCSTRELQWLVSAGESLSRVSLPQHCTASTIHDTSLDIVHLVRLDGGSTRTEAGIVHHGTRRDIAKRSDQYDGILASVPARAVWEVACRSSLEGGVVTADSALHRSPESRNRWMRCMIASPSFRAPSRRAP